MFCLLALSSLRSRVINIDCKVLSAACRNINNKIPFHDKLIFDQVFLQACRERRRQFYGRPTSIVFRFKKNGVSFGKLIRITVTKGSIHISHKGEGLITYRQQALSANDFSPMPHRLWLRKSRQDYGNFFSVPDIVAHLKAQHYVIWISLKRERGIFSPIEGKK